LGIDVFMTATNRVILILACLAALGGWSVGIWLEPVPYSPLLRTGALRADVALPDLNGQEQRMAQWDGKLVLLNFWASWCAPCREEMPLLEQTQKKYAPQGVQVIGIAVDELQSVKDFLATLEITYPVLLNTPGKSPDLSTLYGNERGVLPYSVLIDRDGRIISQHTGSFSASNLQEWLKIPSKE